MVNDAILLTVTAAVFNYLTLYRVNKLWGLVIFMVITASTFLVLTGNDIAIGVALAGIPVIALAYYLVRMQNS